MFRGHPHAKLEVSSVWLDSVHGMGAFILHLQVTNHKYMLQHGFTWLYKSYQPSIMHIISKTSLKGFHHSLSISTLITRMNQSSNYGVHGIREGHLIKWTQGLIYHYQIIMVIVGDGGLNGKGKGEWDKLSVNHHVKVSQLGQGCHQAHFSFFFLAFLMLFLFLLEYLDYIGDMAKDLYQ